VLAVGGRQGGESSDGDGDGDGERDSDSDRRAERVTGRLRCSRQRQRQRQKQRQKQVHALPAGRSRGWDLAELSLQAGNWEPPCRQSAANRRSCQTPDARRQQPARAYVAPRYYFRHLQPPLAHAPTRSPSGSIPTRLTLAIATTSGSLQRYILCIHHIIIITIISVIHHVALVVIILHIVFPRSVPFSSCFFLFSCFLSSSTVPSTIARHYQCPFP
jgi:hypothetical protein